MGYGLIALPWPFVLDRPIIPKEVSRSKYNVEQVITLIWTESVRWSAKPVNYIIMGEEESKLLLPL